MGARGQPRRPTQVPEGSLRVKRAVVAAVVAGAALTMLVTMVPAAWAETVTFGDPRGDAPARNDLTRATAKNDDVVLVTSKVRNLRGGTQIFMATLQPRGADVIYRAFTLRRSSGRVSAELWRDDLTGGAQVDCPIEGRWRLGRDDVRVRFPHECLTEHGRQRITALIGAGDGSAGDPADWTRTVPVDFG